MSTISRTDILEKLDLWRNSRLSATALRNWVEEMLLDESLDFDDWDAPRKFSAAKEAVTELEMLDINLVTEEDIPAFEEFLNAPKSEFGAAYIQFISKLQAIDRNARRKTLKKTEPYARHCALP